MVDANVLIAAARGRSSGAILAAGRIAALVTTDRVLQEAFRRIELGLKRPELLGIVSLLLREMTVVRVAALEPLLVQGETVLRDAVPRRNGSVPDAQVLVLAWSVDGDGWTAGRDFAGTGVATWSTPDLMRAIAAVDRTEA